MQRQRLIKISLLVAIMQVVVGHTVAAPQVEPQSADGKFIKYLVRRMYEDGDWIRENNLDPSHPIPDTIILEPYWYWDIELNCTIRQQVMSGHSDVTSDVLAAESYFAYHAFVIGRSEIHAPHEIKGIYNCTGTLFASADLSNDLPFQGEGNFTVQVKSASDVLEFVNFGITDNYEFSTEHVWYNYFYYPGTTQLKLAGTWDSSSAVDKYFNLINSAFEEAYFRFFGRDESPQAHLNPSRQIFIRFIEEVVKTTNLKEVLSGEELPEPYIPTSTTTTTSKPLHFL